MRFPPAPLTGAVLAALILPAASPLARGETPAKTLPLPGEVFAVAGRTAFVIPPREDARAPSPTPWVWYAPILPKLPGEEERWMFERFTAAGIAIAGIDVGESYGSPEGRRLYTAFHDELTRRRGFSPKPVLLGRSRGGLMTLSWAAEHPDRVAGFAGIYPVCNLSSYPGIAKAAPAYGLTAEALQSRLAEYNPIDRLAGLARARVPLFAIHGDVDRVVPLEANSGELERRYRSLGGPMTLQVPAGQGHNMWPGFFQCPELVDFVLRHARPAPAPAATPAPAAGRLVAVVAPAATLVEREGITGAGAVVVAGEGAARRLIAHYPSHPDDFGGSVGTGTAFSGDGGGTWTAGSDDWPLPGLVDLWQDRLRNGDLIAFGLRWAPDPARRGEITPAEVPPDAYPFGLSRDGGHTWEIGTATLAYPAEIGVIARPLFHLFEDASGALHMPAYAWGRHGNRALLLRSEDRGRSWRMRSSIATAAALVQAGATVTTPWLETSVLPVADGSWLAVIRTGSSAGAGLMMARSRDQGRTWSAPGPVLAGPGRRPVAGKLPTLQRLPDGPLLLLTAHTKNHCRLYLSPDGSGQTWDQGIVLTSQSGGNAGITVTGPDSVLVTSPANRRIDAWRVTFRPDPGPPSPAVAAPAAVTVSGTEARVRWTPPADPSPAVRYRVTPVLLAPPPGNPDLEILPYAPVETPDAATADLVLGRKLAPGARYRVEVSTVDRGGRLSPPALSAEFTAGAAP